jgi:hypothetical protein
VTAVEGVRRDLAARDADQVCALTRLVEACNYLAERIQADRVERAALVDAVARLMVGTAPYSGLPRGETIIGGSVNPSSSPNGSQSVGGESRDGDQTLAETVQEPGDMCGSQTPSQGPVEVRCRFGEEWVDGFEIHDVFETSGTLRYRLRRRSDDYILPKLFDENDVRPYTQRGVAWPMANGKAKPSTRRTSPKTAT